MKNWMLNRGAWVALGLAGFAFAAGVLSAPGAARAAVAGGGADPNCPAVINAAGTSCDITNNCPAATPDCDVTVEIDLTTGKITKCDTSCVAAAPAPAPAPGPVGTGT